MAKKSMGTANPPLVFPDTCNLISILSKLSGYFLSGTSRGPTCDFYRIKLEAEPIPVYLMLLPTMAPSSGIFQEGKEKKRDHITFGAEIRIWVAKQNKDCIDFPGYPAVECHTADKPPGQFQNCKRRLIL